MSRYSRGDVILVNYVFEDPKTGRLLNKPRPVVVYEESSHDERLVIQCTSNNKSDRYPGIWVLKDSDEGKEMGILNDSFIHISERREIPFSQIIRRIGHCPLMEIIDDIIAGI